MKIVNLLLFLIKERYNEWKKSKRFHLGYLIVYYQKKSRKDENFFLTDTV